MKKIGSNKELVVTRRSWLPPILLAILYTPLPLWAGEPGKPESPPQSSAAQTIIERTKREFRKARFNKPENSDASGIEQKLAPLIVEEFGEATSPKIGALLPSPGKDHAVPFRPATIYFDEREVECGSLRHAQLIFVWWYEQQHESRRVIKPTFLPRGVRIVVDSDGMPVLWEALQHLRGLRMFFVSQSFELAAREQFGAPLPGRRFSVERSLADASNIIVSGILDDGPMPMGPYVYVDASSQRAISTIHCRCSPSQFEEIVETNEYELTPLKELDSHWLRERGGIDMDKLGDESMEDLFRWPKL